MKYYLIHGYGKALDVGEKEIPANLGFYIFDEELKNGNAKVFDWATRIKRNFLTPFNPLAQIKLYFDDKKKTESRDLQAKLIEDLKNNSPEIVICHSMGCRLFLNTLRNFRVPTSVKKVIFVLAEPKRSEKITDSKFDFFNFYCCWDYTLFTAIFLNLYLPMGLVGATDKKAKNIFWKLKNGLSLHQGIWEDNDFKNELLKIT